VADLLSDPIDLQVDSSGDLVFTNGDITFTSGLEGVVDQIHLALQSIRGEWFLDLDEGVPYYEGNGVDPSEALLGQPFAEDRTRSEIRAAILGVTNVRELLHLATKLDGATRALSVEFRAATSWGDTGLVEVVL
jgi:hypothetical protein